MPEVVAYARVSSREQAENWAALDQQIARLKAAGAEIVLTDTESGREGKEDQRSNCANCKSHHSLHSVSKITEK
ncbi:recombinase family protein [Nostoc sp. FACHB-190]|nr:recombinase family protein [Nostoc sp. FACHB-190]